MLELYAAAVFDNFFFSSGPQIELFKRFKSQWAFIDNSKFEQLDSNQDGAGALNTAEMDVLHHGEAKSSTDLANTWQRSNQVNTTENSPF